jgi:hypothetical protein
MAKAQPIWKREPKAVTPMAFSVLRVKDAMEAMPGKLQSVSWCEDRGEEAYT